MRLASLFLALLLATACAGTSQHRRGDEPWRAEIQAFNQEELWACGNAAWQAQDFEKAAACYGLLADRHPEGRRWRQAQQSAALALESLERWEEALARYEAIQAREGSGDADLRFRVVSCLYHLSRYEEALALLGPFLEERDLRPEDRIRALTYAGICKVEMGELEEAEAELRKALFFHRRHENQERVDEFFPSQAQFFLGEIYRLHFEALPLDQTDDVEQVKEDLEQKSQLLLSAQGHYLRTIRRGHPHWATAAGQRVGQLYEALYDEMMSAPVPAHLDPDQAALYRAMLRQKVRVLVQKAIAIYERNLAAAERTRVDSPFIEWTRESLQRMRGILLRDESLDEVEAS